jgi:hypothetical protein
LPFSTKANNAKPSNSKQMLLKPQQNREDLAKSKAGIEVGKQGKIAVAKRDKKASVKNNYLPRPILNITSMKSPNAKAGEGATIKLSIKDEGPDGGWGSLMSVLFFDWSYIESEEDYIAFRNAFVEGGSVLQAVWDSAKYVFPSGEGPKGGVNEVDTSFVIAAGTYDLSATDYDEAWWIPEGFSDGVVDIGYPLDNYEFKDGYIYVMELLIGEADLSVENLIVSIPPHGLTIDNVIKPDNSISLGSSEEFKVIFSSNGQNPLTNATFFFQIGENAMTAIPQTWNGDLEGDETDTISFTADFSAAGKYGIKIWADVDDYTSNTYQTIVNHATPLEPRWEGEFDLYNSEWNIVDLNGLDSSGKGTWIMYPDYEENVSAVYVYHDNLPGDDYLVTAAPFTLAEGTNYQFVISVNGSYWPEKVEAYFGTSSNPEEMTPIGGYDVLNTIALERGFNFTVPANDDYYIAIKAASDSNNNILQVNYAILDTGIFVPNADLTVNNIIWADAYPSCELPEAASALVVVENRGNAVAKNKAISYQLDGGEWKTIAIEADSIIEFDYVVVAIDSLDVSVPELHTLKVAVSSITPEDDTTELTIYPTEVAEFPFNSHFLAGEGEDNWETQNAWTFLGEGDGFFYDLEGPGYGLMSKCLTFEAGTSYGLDISYWGISFPGYEIITSFDVRIGRANAPIESFEVLKSYNEINSGEDFEFEVDNLNFSVEASGEYVIAIYPTEYLYDAELAFYYGISSELYIGHVNIGDGSAIAPLRDGSANALRVHPVPVKDIITVDGVVKDIISIVDVSGRTVMQSNAAAGRTLLNVSDLPSGVYMLHHGGQSTKFIKK